ncbi:MAG: glycosyltransferase family 2 protein [Candidatus Hydrogenedentales bacterium]
MTPHPLPPSVAVVVPCYNAGERVLPVAAALASMCERVIVVDDGSTDGAIEALRDLPILIERFHKNRGKGHALVHGCRTALDDSQVQCVACVDADGQHDPAELPNLYAEFEGKDADFVIGSRQFGGVHVPWRSRFGNEMTIRIAGRVLGRRLPDTQSGYRLLSRRYLEAELPHLRGGRYETEMEMLARAVLGGYRVVPVPIATLYETGNPSSHFGKLRDSYRIIRTLVSMRRRLQKETQGKVL